MTNDALGSMLMRDRRHRYMFASCTAAMQRYAPNRGLVQQ